MSQPTIRVARPEDGEHVAAIYRPYVVSTPITFETEPPSGAAMSERIESILPRWPWLVWEERGRVLGYAYASEYRARIAYRWSVDVAVYVDSTAHRRGIGRRLYQALFPLLTLQRLENAYAGITLPNAGSVGLHEAMGFRTVGVYSNVGWKLGAWHDVGWWGLALGRYPTPPPEPIPFGELRESPEVAAILSRV